MQYQKESRHCLGCLHIEKGDISAKIFSSKIKVTIIGILLKIKQASDLIQSKLKSTLNNQSTRFTQGGSLSKRLPS